MVVVWLVLGFAVVGFMLAAMGWPVLVTRPIKLLFKLFVYCGESLANLVPATKKLITKHGQDNEEYPPEVIAHHKA